MKKATRLFWGGFVALLVVLYVSSAMAIDVPVSVTNGTGKSGRVYLSIVTGGGTTGSAGSTGIGKSVAIDENATADVTIAGLQEDGSYRIKAFLDTQDLGWQHANDPTGETTFSVQAGAVAAPADGIKLTLTAPAPVTVAPTPSVKVIPGPSWAFVIWNNPDNGENFDVAESYNVYWSTQSDPSIYNAIGTSVGLPVSDGAPLLIPDLTPNTSLYVAVVPVVNGEEQLSAKGVNAEAVQIGEVQQQTGSSVTVTVTSAGVAKDPDWPTPLVVALVNENDDIKFAVVPVPTDSETVTFNGVPAGTYKIYTALDLYGNGYLSGGLGVIGLNETIAPIVTVDGVNPVTAESIDLTGQLSVNADVRLGIDHGRKSDVPDSDSYAANFRIADQASHVVNVRLDAYGVDVAREEWYPEFNYHQSLADRPAVGDPFGVTVEYADGTVETLYPQVTAVLDSFATPTAPRGTLSITDTTPTFTWTAPEAPPTPYWYDLWFNNGGGSDQRIPSDQLSLPYNFNGWMSPLTPGGYDWSIVVADRKGNTAHQTASFNIPVTVSGIVKTPDGTGLANITVEVILGGNSALSVVTGDDGSFTISDIPGGSNFTLRASGTDIVTTSFGPFDGKSDVTGATLQVLTDATPPQVSFSVKSVVNTLTVPVLSFIATDDTGATGYLITETSETPDAGATSWKQTAPVSYTFTTAGKKTVWAWAKDGAGHVSAATSATVNVDVTAPVVSTFTLKTPVNTLAVPVTAVVSSDPVGGTGIAGYLITTTSGKPLATATGWSATAPKSYTFTSAGNKTVWIWAKDGAGNVSAGKSAAVTVDMTPPAVTAFAVKTPVNSLVVPVTSFTASITSGVTGYRITTTSLKPLATATGWSATAPKSYTVSGAGIRTLYAWVKDAAGNVSAYKSAVVNVDVTAPLVTAFTLKSPVNTLAVPVTALTATDASGVAGYLITATSTKPLATATGWTALAPKGYTVAGAGIRTLYAWAKDAAGNVSALKSAIVNVDLTAPLVTAFTVPAKVNTLTVPVTTFTASDATGVAGYLVTVASTKPLATATGWSATAPKSFAFTTKGTKLLYAWAKDAAGNVSLAKTATVVIN